ncbi:MAG: winged helix-turn-helix transcriptional regulator [Patescibacteria group bacterium]|nr:winged helix-turn-helix transcriptional regulator [Patescibacteria group bacterium]
MLEIFASWPRLTIRQVTVLFFLADGVQHDFKCLRLAVRISAAALSRNCTTLTEYGLVERRRDEHDCRRCWVRATDKGRELIALAQAKLKET